MGKKNNTKIKAAKRRVARQQKSQKKKAALKKSTEINAKQAKQDRLKMHKVLHKMISEMLLDALPERTRAIIKPNHIRDAADFCVTEGFTIVGDSVIPNADIPQMAELLVTEVDEEMANREELRREGWVLCQE